MNRIMLVDDDVSVIDALKRRMKLHRKSWKVDTFSDPLNALEAMKSNQYDIIVSDFSMPHINGAVFLTESKVFQRDAIRIVLSGQAQLEGIIQAINEAEIYRYIEKPVNSEQLLITIDQAIHYRQVLVENEELANTVRRQRNELARARKYIDTYAEQYPGVKFDDWNDDSELQA